jgi:hypothetical protein
MPCWRVRIARWLIVAAASAASSCATSTSPTLPTPCVVTITLSPLPNAQPSPGQGQVWTSYFAATTLSAQGQVFLVDVNADPGCLGGWTAVSANTSAVQLSPARGSGRGQVELFMPPNTGPQRSTIVTIAGQTATITQAGR